MPLVKSKQILAKAMKGGYAVGHFNVHNLEIVQAVANAAAQRRSPVFMAVTATTIKFAGLGYLVALARKAAEESGASLILHLDHGRDLSVIKACVDAGFTSVMCDASNYEFEKNVEITKKAVRIAHARGIPVEAELGKVTTHVNGLGMDERRTIFTDPIEAREFVKKTKADSLAISIGTSHGAYKFSIKPELDFERLRLIREEVTIPLVLHGASEINQPIVKKGIRYGARWQGAKGLDKASVRTACRNGISKLNFHTDLSLVYLAATREHLAKHRAEMDPRLMLDYCREALQRYVADKIGLVGSAGKA